MNRPTPAPETDRERFVSVLKTTGSICHELNQPLMVIMGLSEILLEDLAGGEVREKHMKDLQHQIIRMGQITRRLMAVTNTSPDTLLGNRISDP